MTWLITLAQASVEVADGAAGESAAASMTGGVPFATLLIILVLAIFVGFEIITKVPPTLHTPLMSGSNAISGITIVGALIAAGISDGFFQQLFGFIAVVLATLNVVGGYLVTHRMLGMFKKKG